MGDKIIKRIKIPFEKGAPFNNGKQYLDRADDDFFGVMVNGQAVFISREHARELEITETELSVDLPLWYITHKSLEIFIDTSDEPTLF